MSDGMFLPPAMVPELATADALAAEQVATADPDAPAKPHVCDICGNSFTRKSRLNAHRMQQHQAPPAPAEKPGRKPADKAPAGVTVNLHPTRAKGKDADLAAVEERAAQLAQTVAAVVLLMGQPEDATDLQRGAPAWAASVRGLAEHEEWLRKLATGGESAGRAMAWLQFAIATGALVSPILARHDLLPGNLAELAEGVFSVGASLQTPPDAPPG